MNGISSWSIRNPIPIILLFLVLTIAGVVGYSKLRINNFPDIDMPVVAVTVAQPGAAPTELETQVTRQIEDAVAGLGQVKHIRSTVNDGVSTTTIEFQLGVDLEKVTNDVRNAVAGARQNLPSDVQEPIVQRLDFTGAPIVSYVVRAPGLSPEQISWLVENEIAKRLLSIKGVAQVQRDGGVKREIRIKLDPQKLASLGVTAAEVSNQLKATNINLPGGRSQIGGDEQAMRTLGGATSLEDLRNQRIALPNGGSVLLRDLGEVVDEWAEQRGLARFNGKEVVGFGVVRSKGSSEVAVYRAVQKAVTAFDESRPDVTIELVDSATENVLNSFNASVEALLLGAVLAVFVVWLFLRDWRATFVTAMAMPLSLIPTFWIMDMLNQSLNVVSLLALSLTVGILVDDAIVEIENIVRHIRDGKAPYPAAIEAADEIGLAVVATTATLVAVFAPTGFMPGIVGQFFKSFAIACCVSVLFSLLVARTLTPLMGAYILRRDQKAHGDPFWMAGYMRALSWGLNHRIIGVIGAVVFFILSLAVAAQLPADFIPAEDRGTSRITVELPPGATLADTDRITQRMTQMLLNRPEVATVYSSIGSATISFGPDGSSSAGEIRKATLTIGLVPKGKRMRQQAFEREMSEMFRAVPGARISLTQNAGGPSGQLSISLVSDNPEALEKTTDAVAREVASIPGLSNVFSTYSLVRPELLIRPKPEKAALLGVSSQAISQAARVATIGDADQLLPKFNLPDRQIPIRVMLQESQRARLDVIENLRVPTATGASVPLSAVADISFGAGPNQIDRLNRQRTATVKAELNGQPLGLANTLAHQLPSLKTLPAGVKEQQAGDLEGLQELGTGFAFAIGTGIMLMYVVLVLLFRSFFHPITILTALPLSFGGAFLLLLVTVKSMSMPALIGIIMLTGIAAKNSILLVEYGIEAMKAGMGRRDAMLDAAHKRARPILMTTVAMGAGMAPIAMGLGVGVEFRQPMAIAVIGGLFTSTLLSLLFVPVAFTIVDDIRGFFARKASSRFKPEGKDEVDALPATPSGEAR